MLTDQSTKALIAPEKGSRITYDGPGGEPGFGVRVTANGVKAFILTYRNKGHVDRRFTIGKYPAWSVDKARKEARRLRTQIDRGSDPVAERDADRKAPFVRDLAERYIEEHLSKKRPSTRYDVEGQLRKWILPAIGSLKVADVRPADIERLHAKITNAGSPIRANRCISTVSKMMSLAIRWEMRSDNPCRHAIERNAENKRNRFLSPVEIARLSEALAQHTNQQSADLIRLLMLTGARPGETMRARWDPDIDFDAGTWTKPGSTTKQATLHLVPLSAPARELLVRMKGQAKTEYLFPGREGRGHLTTIKKSWSAIAKAADLPGVRLYDAARHSFASISASSGASLSLIGALLGHSNPATTARYAHLMLDPLREAAERVGAVVTGKPSADIVPLKRA
jgi:integrase